MESCVSQFNAWPVILFTTLQQAGAKAAGKLAIHPISPCVRMHRSVNTRHGEIEAPLLITRSGPGAGSSLTFAATLDFKGKKYMCVYILLHLLLSSIGANRFLCMCVSYNWAGKRSLVCSLLISPSLTYTHGESSPAYPLTHTHTHHISILCTHTCTPSPS